MRWGVRDEATDDHQTVNLCSREIYNCQRMSLGPNFVAFLGDKYGFRPLRNRIKSTEYRALRRCLIEMDVNTDFMDTWYKEDLNAVPPEYLLQPVSSILKNFTNKTEPVLQATDQCIWQAVQDRLHELLMIGSNRLVEQGRISREEQLMKYSISVTEREIIEGCLDMKDAKSHCLVYVRSIVDLRDQVQKCLIDQISELESHTQAGEPSSTSGSSSKGTQVRKASLKIGEDVISLNTSGSQGGKRKSEKSRRLIGRYVDLVAKDNVWTVNEEAQKALAELRDTKLEAKFKSNVRNLTKFRVSWNEAGGISVKSEEHKRYLNDLTDHFYHNLKRMIRKASKERHESKSGFIGEVLQHSHYAIYVSKTFHGRRDELNRLRSYILGPHQNGVLPMFIYGVGGSGKTSILARAATLAKHLILSADGAQGGHSDDQWDRKPCIIMRFCCTTPNSSSMVGVLTSVCRQLQYNFYQYGLLNGTSDQNGISLDQTSGDVDDPQLPYQQIPDDFIQLVFTFRQLLENCRHRINRNRLFLIILDSVERLTSSTESNVGAKYSWLTSIVRLPPNVRLIISCSSERTLSSQNEDFVHLKRHFLQAYFFNQTKLRVESLSTNTEVLEHQDMLNTKWMESEQRVQVADSANATILFSRTLGKTRPSAQLEAYPKISTTTGFHRVFGELLLKLSLKCYARSGDEKSAHSSGYHDSSAGVGSEYTSGLAEDVWILHIRPLGQELGLEVVRNWLAGANRSLTQQQWSMVGKSFASCSRPIFVKLAFGEFVNWKSYSMQSDTKGLTFGSSMLIGRQDLLTGNSATDSILAQLLRESDQTDELEWQILNMEQQWLNYLDYEQTRAQKSADSERNSSKLESNEEPVVFRVKSMSGSGLVHSSASSSTFSASICHLSSTIDDAICQLFARIELQHGYLLVKHSLSYITSARDGICENELEDILSLDDVVLDDVFQYHLPPVRRIPPLLWTRIRNDLPEYLSERDADGIVINWHHGEFKRVTEDRYLSDPQQVLYIHSILADYFQGKWADKAKPFRCTKQQIQMAAEQLESAVQQSVRDSQTFGPRGQRSSLSGVRSGTGSASVRSGASFSVRSRLRSSDQYDSRLQWMQAKADRRVPQQPLHYEGRSEAGEGHEQMEGGTSVVNREQVKRHYNMRKLIELPYHLMQSGRYLDLATEVLFNYRWLFARISSTGLQSLLIDFAEARQSLRRAVENSTVNMDPSSSQERAPVSWQELELREVTPADRLDTEVLQSMVSQLDTLNSTIRLSCSAIHNDTQMLAPQLIGRLLPLVRQSSSEEQVRVKYLSQLLDQCDKVGCSDCALLPVDHCLQSPDGLQLSSLEGHSFAIMSMQLAADQRHLLAVSNRFIMWDTTTGEVSRDVDPKIEGSLMKELKMGYNNEYAIAYTSNNTVLVLDILTQQVIKYGQLELEEAMSKRQPILGLELIDKFGATRFVVWTKLSFHVLGVTSNELKASGPVMQRLAVELEFSMDLTEIGDGERELGILSVAVEPIPTNDSELAFIELETGDDQIQLLTLNLKKNGYGRTFEPWPESITAKSLALDASRKQLIVCDSTGAIYLRRRRKTCWSRKKLLRTHQEVRSESDSMCRGGSRNWRAFGALNEQESESAPMAVEFETSDECLSSLDPRLLVSKETMAAISSFEQRFDSVAENDEIVANRIFDQEQEGGSLGSREAPTGSVLVKLYFCNRIVLLRLAGDGVKEQNLVFPKSVRNISIQPNRCQVKSLVVEGGAAGRNFLVAAVGRRMLVYSIDSGQFLRFVDAHSARIVQLLPVFKRNSTNTRQEAQIFNEQLCMASASMDKTVKIWNLSNLNKDIHALDRLEHSIEWLSLAAQWPLVACLTRCELGVWDWSSLRLVAKFHQSDFSQQDNERATRIVRCRLSLNGRYLCVATLDSIHLLATNREAPAATSAVRERKGDGHFSGDPEFKLNFKHALPVACFVVKLKFFLQDSRLLTVLDGPECAKADSEARCDSSGGMSSSGAGSRLTDPPSWRPFRRILILCHSVPDGRLLFTIDCSTPAIANGARDSHYLTAKRAARRPSRHEPGETSGQLGADEWAAAAARNGCVRLPVLTRDQLNIVTVESGAERGELEQGIGRLERRRSSAMAKLQISLNVYSTREGALVRSIKLNQLEHFNPQVKDTEAGLSASRSRQQGVWSNSAGEGPSRSVSVGADQFTRLKSVNYRERQTIVALLDDEKGSSFLIDVSTKQLMAHSSIWNGKLSSDGRFGLSRMFKTSGLGSSARVRESRSSRATLAAGGLQLLEMRHCSPVKSLLTNETLSQLSAGDVQTTGSEADIICGFTQPNDSYVYYYDPRLKRLLLLRLRDGQLVANYKLSGLVTRIKCSSDGYALVLAFADGSLTSLAIVDLQANDTLLRLAQYPSRSAG